MLLLPEWLCSSDSRVAARLVSGRVGCAWRLCAARPVSRPVPGRERPCNWGRTSLRWGQGSCPTTRPIQGLSRGTPAWENIPQATPLSLEGSRTLTPEVLESMK